MAVTAQFLKSIMAEARPIIERQMNDAKIIAGLRTVVANNGGDWGALKALIKAHVEDENDETGDGKRVQKIRDKADSTSAYADMLGLANMNENNFSAGNSYADAKLVETVAAGIQTETGRKALVTALDIMIEREEAVDPETGEITEQPETAQTNSPSADQPADAVAEPQAPQAQTATASHSEMRGFLSGLTDEQKAEALAYRGPETHGEHEPFQPPAFLRKTPADYRPHCQNPEACASSGLRHCYSCTKLLESEDAA